MGLAGPICLGGFLDYINYPMIIIGFITMQVIGLIYLTEKVRALEILAQFVVLISLLFFFRRSLMLIYIFYELSIVPIIFMILGYGSQVEKIGAAYYLIFYVSLCSAPFLFVYYRAGYYELRPFSSIQLAWPYALMLSLVFIVKLPVYFFHI